MRPAPLLPLLLLSACYRVTAFCEGDGDCAAGWSCGPEDRCVPPAPDLPAAELPLPAWSCRALKAVDRSLPDGEYTLYAGGDPARPWRAFCLHMDGDGDLGRGPAEYLTLSPERNFSRFPTGGTATGTTVLTSYARVRIDPLTLLVDAGDQTFATSSGQLRIPGGDEGRTVTAMPFAVAMDCLGAGSATGAAEIDLGGTPFFVVTAIFRRGGSAPGGAATYSEDRKRVSLSGGGACGWVAAGDSGYPINQSGPAVPLRYP